MLPCSKHLCADRIEQSHRPSGPEVVREVGAGGGGGPPLTTFLITAGEVGVGGAGKLARLNIDPVDVGIPCGPQSGHKGRAGGDGRPPLTAFQISTMKRME